MVVHEDGLDDGGSVGRQQPVDGLEVGRPELLAHRLDHLDAHDSVELPRHLSVVLELHVDPVGQPQRGDPFLREGLLLPGQRDRRDKGAAGRRADRQLAPTGADFEQPGACGDTGRVEGGIDLATLGRGQILLAPRSRRLVEQCAAVGHRLVEEAREQVVAEVVVRRDVGARPFRGVAVVMRDGPLHDPAKGEDRPGQQPFDPGGKRREQVTQIGPVSRLPVAGHVGLPSPIFGWVSSRRNRSAGRLTCRTGASAPPAPRRAVGKSQAHRQ